MITTLEQAKLLANEYNKIKKDKDRLTFLKANNKFMKVVLDNDATMVLFIINEDVDGDIEYAISEIFLEYFDKFHGWEDSIVELFEFAGITAETC